MTNTVCCMLSLYKFHKQIWWKRAYQWHGRQYHTWLGNLGQCNTERNKLICVQSPKVANSSRVLFVKCCLLCQFNIKICQCTRTFHEHSRLYYTCLGHLGKCNTERNYLICVKSFKVANSSRVLFVECCLLCQFNIKFCECTRTFHEHSRHYCTWLGNLGQCDTDRNDLICVKSPKVAKTSTVVFEACCYCASFT